MLWLSQNWFFVLFALLFVGMHLRHGGHGGHRAANAVPTPAREDGDARPPRRSDNSDRPAGHHQ